MDVTARFAEPLAANAVALARLIHLTTEAYIVFRFNTEKHDELCAFPRLPLYFTTLRNPMSNNERRFFYFLSIQ